MTIIFIIIVGLVIVSPIIMEIAAQNKAETASNKEFIGVLSDTYATSEYPNELIEVERAAVKIEFEAEKVRRRDEFEAEKVRRRDEFEAEKVRRRDEFEAEKVRRRDDD